MKSLISILLTFIILIFINISTATAQEFSDYSNDEEIWNKHSMFLNTHIKLITSSNKITKNSISTPLTLIVPQDSDWTYNQVLAKVRRTELIYKKQCNINFAPIIYVSTKHKMDSTVDVDGDSILDYNNLNPLVNQGALLKPAIFLVNKKKESNKRPNNAGVAMRNVPGNNGIENTLFLFNITALRSSKSYPLSKPFKKGYYEVMAHELSHILLNQSHSKIEGTLISNRKGRTNKITKDQCKKIIANLDMFN